MPASSDTDRGDTLVELIVAIAVLSIAVAALLGALITSWGSSSEHRSLTTVDTVLRTFAEEAKYDIQLQSSPWYQDCATITSNPPAYSGHQLPAPGNVPSGWSAPFIQSIAYWNPSGTFDATCQSGDYQVLTVAVAAPDGSAKTLTIGLRNPT